VLVSREEIIEFFKETETVCTLSEDNLPWQLLLLS